MKSSRRKLEQADLLSACEQQGYTVQRTRKGYRVFMPGGQGMAHLHMTPSDHRAYQNTVRDLKKIGVEL
jgi:hypothetical protein